MKVRDMVSRAVLVSCATALAALAGTAAGEPVSGSYDGTYRGASELQNHLSADACGGPARYEAEVTGGELEGRARETEDRFTGLVTADGFFTGTYRSGDGWTSTFQGRIDEGELLGGVTTPDRDCYWLVRLERL